MNNAKKERTFVIIKPDAIQRGLVGEIIKRIESTGLKLVAIKFANASEEKLWTHYNKDDAWFLKQGQRLLDQRAAAGLPVEKEAIEYGKDIIKALVKFMTCSPVIMMVWEGNQAVGIIKKIVGATEPLSSDGGTIRGDYTLDSYELANLDNRAIRNLIHCSDPVADAEREIPLWFGDDEIMNYRLITEEILYDVNLDGIKE
jgi:nucleoside-diphosphate kinase